MPNFYCNVDCMFWYYFPVPPSPIQPPPLPPIPVNDRHDLYGEWGENFPIFSAKMVQIPQKALRQEPSSAQNGGGGVKGRVDFNIHKSLYSILQLVN
jgi:hypothetical protein